MTADTDLTTLAVVNDANGKVLASAQIEDITDSISLTFDHPGEKGPKKRFSFSGPAYQLQEQVTDYAIIHDLYLVVE